jgi:hypothetical protein
MYSQRSYHLLNILSLLAVLAVVHLAVAVEQVVIEHQWLEQVAVVVHQRNPHSPYQLELHIL